jgi:hypothetical protein
MVGLEAIREGSTLNQVPPLPRRERVGVRVYDPARGGKFLEFVFFVSAGTL